MNLSTLKVALPANGGRGPSPTPEGRHRLQVPGATRTDDAKYMWGDEEVELIQTCGLLSSSLGLSKSLSTSDIFLKDFDQAPRAWVSEENLGSAEEKLEGIFPTKLEPISRSCSTWVAVGDVVTTSQLPSPQARIGANNCPAITAVDFIRSVNKKVRQNYIKRRLLMSYRVLKRNPHQCKLPPGSSQKFHPGIRSLLPRSPCPPQDIFRKFQNEVPVPITTPDTSSTLLSARDIERDQGRSLSRFERNMIIFNWLQSLDDGPPE